MSVPPRSRGVAALRAEKSFIAREVLLPAQPFIHTAGKSSIVLLAAAIIALAWANSPWKESYFTFWGTEISIDLGFLHIAETLRDWVNDALMAIFFFVVGLEVKHEIVRGELSNPRHALLPLMAALGGMIVPAALFISLNLGGSGFSGWGIPMATDIAFALGVLAMLGTRLPAEARIFLLALAIADDIGAILVIAVFYTEHLSLLALGLGALLLGLTFAMNRLGVRNISLYIVVGALFWLAVLESGVHATIAGVLLGILTPAHPYFGIHMFEQAIQQLVGQFREAVHSEDEEKAETILGQMEELVAGTESPVERLERQISPWTSYLVLPIFALANAGLTLSGNVAGEALSSPVTLGILLGLVVGKPVGIIGFVWIAHRLRIASLPTGMRWSHVLGIGMLAGIGFTVSLFVTELAFSHSPLSAEAKIGVLLASVIAGLAGYVFLLVATRGGIPRIDGASSHASGGR